MGRGDISPSPPRKIEKDGEKVKSTQGKGYLVCPGTALASVVITFFIVLILIVHQFKDRGHSVCASSPPLFPPVVSASSEEGPLVSRWLRAAATIRSAVWSAIPGTIKYSHKSHLFFVFRLGGGGGGARKNGDSSCCDSRWLCQCCYCF